MPRADARLPAVLGPRDATVVAVAPHTVRLDIDSDEGEHDRASVIRDVAWAQRLITDLQRAVAEAMRMQP